MFPHEITVFREENGVYKRYYVYGVLWEDTKGNNMEKSGLKTVNSVTLYIPFSSGFKPMEKDFVLKGIVNYDIAKKPSELYSVGDVRVINSVDTYDYGNLQHYKAGGS